MTEEKGVCMSTLFVIILIDYIIITYFKSFICGEFIFIS